MTNSYSHSSGEGTGAEEETLERIQTISTHLAGARAPAFYWERDYGTEEARQAMEEAAFVLATVMKWLGEEVSG
ncbi:MAG: hypothetical protein ACE5MB_07465 [Anaerolineae bacterium]